MHCWPSGLAVGPAAQPSSGRPPIPLTNMRHAFFGRFTPTEHWLLISESLARRGKTAGCRRRPSVSRPRASRRSGAVDRPWQCACRPCRDADARERARLPPRDRAVARTIRRRASSTGWRSPVRETAKRPSPCGAQILAEAPADASWRPLVEDAIAALEGPRRAASGRDRLVRKVERLGDGLVADLAARHVETVRPGAGPAASLPRPRDWRSSARTAGSHC